MPAVMIPPPLQESCLGGGGAAGLQSPHSLQAAGPDRRASHWGAGSFGDLGDRGWLILPRTGHVNRQDPHPHLSLLLPGSSPSLLWVCWCGTLEGRAKRGPASQSQCQHPCHLLLQCGTQNLSPTYLYPPLHPACPEAAGLASLPAASEPWGAARGSCSKELCHSGTEEMAELLDPRVSVPEAAFPWGPSQGN